VICYLIQCHKEPEQIRWLVDVLHDRGNVFVLSVDGTDAYFQEIESCFNGRDDIRVVRSRPVTWCGTSQVVVLLDGLRQALEHFQWNFLVNLSGQCFPLQSQATIKQFLSSAYLGGQSLFMSVFRPRHAPPVLFQGRNAAMRPVDVTLFESKGTHCRIHPELAPYFRSWNDSPVMKAFLRPAMWMGEDVTTRTLYLRPLYEYEARYRAKILRRFPHYCGRAWYLAHRSFVEWVVDSPRTDEMFNFFSTVFEPDESFIQTLAMSDPKWAAGVVRKNYRLNEGRPQSISDESTDSLASKECLFGRKMEFSKSKRFRARIEQLVAAKPKTKLRQRCPA
jgi:hypothetical protein